MGILTVKYADKHNSTSGETTPGGTVELQNVVDAGIANDFLIVRYSDNVVSFTKTDYIDSAQFDPSDGEEADAEGSDDTTDQ